MVDNTASDTQNQAAEINMRSHIAFVFEYTCTCMNCMTMSV